MTLVELVQEVWGWTPEVARGEVIAYWENPDPRRDSWRRIRCIRWSFNSPTRVTGLTVGRGLGDRELGPGREYAVVDPVAFALWVDQLRREYVVSGNALPGSGEAESW